MPLIPRNSYDWHYYAEVVQIPFKIPGSGSWSQPATISNGLCKWDVTHIGKLLQESVDIFSSYQQNISRHFNGYFPGGPGLADSSMSSFCILLKLRMMEVVVTTEATRRAKLQSNRHHQQTNTQLFTGRMPFLSPNQQCQSTTTMNFPTPQRSNFLQINCWNWMTSKFNCDFLVKRYISGKTLMKIRSVVYMGSC